VADPYQVLNVPRTASADEIKKRYRQLAKKLHPDLNPGDKRTEQQFKEATAAYDLLSNPEKRGKYDRGEIDENGQPRPGARGWGDTRAGGGAQPEGWQSARGFGYEMDGDDLSDDLLRNFFNFGGRTRPNLKLRGADVTYKLEIPFVEAARGGRKRLNLADGKTLDVTIPAGTEDGQTLRLKGQGLPGRGGAEAGDAYIEIAIEPHAYFTRDGWDIRLECPITLQEAVLGGTITIPTIEGDVSLKVPPGSNTGTELRLRGKGIAHGHDGKRGDQYIRFVVVLPDAPDPALRDAVAAWAQTNAYDVRGKFKR